MCVCVCVYIPFYYFIGSNDLCALRCLRFMYKVVIIVSLPKNHYLSHNSS